MGEAGRRGSESYRRREAIRRQKVEFVSRMGGADERGLALLRTGLQAFLDRMNPGEWQARRASIVQALLNRPQEVNLERATSVRVQEDDMGWYLFLCQQALEDPMCMDVSQAQRALPFLAGIGSRWAHAGKVKGLARKLDELLTDYRKDPDGLLFEVLVALSYAERGWSVECVEEGNTKSADLIVRRDGRELFVECKRLSRKTAYADTERQQFLRLWDRAKHVLLENRQWVWFKGTFHVDPGALPGDFLTEVFRAGLPIGAGEQLVHDSNRATIHARLIDSAAVRGHMDKFRVKANSPIESRLLGGDWAPENAAVTIIHMIKTSQVVECEAAILGAYIEDIGFACGFTRDFDSAVSIDKKARDITKLLSKAVEQVPDDRPSIIHIAAETMEGIEVERRRTEKVLAQIPAFITNKPVLAIRFHRLQGHQRVDKLYEMDETVDKFQIDGVQLHEIPSCVVVPAGTAMQAGSHWEIYR
jgi:Holliday junction resolvase-like predicted endonuclease